jgi:hypothetical protein
MVYVGRHHVRTATGVTATGVSPTAAAPPGRRTPPRRAAVLPAAACTAVLASLLAPGSPPVQAYAGAAATPAASAAVVGRLGPTAVPTAVPTPINGADPFGGHDPAPTPGPVVPDSSTPGYEPDPRLDPLLNRPSTGPDRYPVEGIAPPAPGSTDEGFDSANPAMRGPDAGSQPSVSAPPTPGPPAAPVAEQRPDPWQFLHDSTIGEWLFLSGFLLLLLCIGGLVTVGWYRRRW